MSSEAARVIAAATRFLKVDRSALRDTDDERSLPVSSDRWEPTATDLLRASEETRELLVSEPGQSSVMQRAGALFDRLAGASWPEDSFGERSEICMMLSFVGWRHASALGMEGESQEWLRVADALTFECSTASESLASFLHLPQGSKSKRLYSAFLAGPMDLFASLAILRRDRTQRSMECIQISSSLYSWLLESSGESLSGGEREFFLGEFAFVAGSTYRALGFRRDSAYWLRVARAHFRKAPANRPLRLKVHVVRLLAKRDMHCFRSLRPRLSGISHRLADFGMYQEGLRARLVIALVEKTLGRNDVALDSLLDLSVELRDSSEQGLLAICLANVAEIYCLKGDAERSCVVYQEALAAAALSMDCCVQGSVWASIGAELLHSHAAVAALERSIEYFMRGGAGSWVGYVRISLGEALISTRRFEEARDQILLAVPIVQRENMVPEGIHALKLLGVIAAQSSDGRDGLRDVLAEMQARFGR